MRIIYRLLLLSVVCGAAPAIAQDGPSAAMWQLFEEYHAWQLTESPEMAMRQGEYANADRVDEVGLAAIERRHAARQKFLQRLRAIDTSGFDGDDALNLALFEREIAQIVEGHQFRIFLAPLTNRSGLHTEVPEMGTFARFASAQDYENYLRRLELIPRQIEDTIELLRLGLEAGITPPGIAIQGLPEQIQALTENGLDALAEPFDRLPASVTPEQADLLRDRYESVSLPRLKAAFGTLHEVLVNEYMPNARKSIAAIDLPDGEAFYAYQLRRMTTTDLSAKEIHETGLREVARIRAEMLEVIRRSDFMQKFPDAANWPDDELFKRFVAYLRSDPRFYHDSAEALLTGYRDICKRVDAELPKLFGHLPRLPYGVRPIPDFMAPNQTTAYYNSGDIRNAQAGYFYANTYALDQRPKYEMISLALHEAVPGHHLQIAIQQELEDAPEFRKDMWVTAFGEGWALYSERLGIEMGFFEDPYNDFGRLLYEMWRACRLVVDPGMHALGWSRERAVNFMLENTALSELNINNEIDRYIAWPGQATAYKLGELKIRELRDRAERELGTAFDLRAFHDVVLSAGCVPLDVLEQRVSAWINAQRSLAQPTTPTTNAG